MKFSTLTLFLAFISITLLKAQVRLNVQGDARITGSVVELIKPSDPGHILNLSSSGTAMDINATTDLYLNSGGNINLDANNPTGRVGVGTANPLTKFHVVGGRLRLSTLGNDNRYIDLRTDGSILDISPVGADLLIDPGANHLLLATQSGGVGIGSGPPPAKKLDVHGEVIFRDENKIGIFHSSGANAFFSFENNGGTAGADVGYFNNTTDQYFFINTPGGNFGEFTILNNGHVGIGTLTPTAKLQVIGEEIKCSSDAGPQLTLTDLTEDNSFQIQYSNTDDKLFFNYLSASNTNNNVLTIDGDADRVSVNTPIATTTFWVRHDNGGTFSGDGFGMVNNTSGENWEFFVEEDGNLSLWASLGLPMGSFDNLSGNYVASSDRKLKRDIKQLSRQQLQKINQLRPVTYHFKERRNQRPVYGLIAQEVQEVYPDLVVNSARDEDGNSVLGVSYTELIPVLIAGMQEQQAIIEQQEHTIAELEGEVKYTMSEQAKKVTALEDKVNKLTNLVNRLLADQSDSPDSSHVLPLEQKATLSPAQPNPFHQQTVIKYFIPASAKDAYLQVTAADGKVLGKVTIRESGKGQVTIQANAYPAGNYFYSLVLDGEVLETQQMVLTR